MTPTMRGDDCSTQQVTSSAARMETDGADDESQHDRWMQRALDLADAAVRQGEVPVGAVFVVDGVEVARGASATNAAMDATRHAELVAVDAALAARRAVDWRNATLYVTCEPCIMCAAALAQLGLRRCFSGVEREIRRMRIDPVPARPRLPLRRGPAEGGGRRPLPALLRPRQHEGPSDRRGDTRKKRKKVGAGMLR